MTTAAFWKGAVERAVKSFCGALLALLGANVGGVLDVDWGQAFSVAAMAAVISVLTSVASSGVGPSGSPSAVDDRPVPPAHVAPNPGV